MTSHVQEYWSGLFFQDLLLTDLYSSVWNGKLLQKLRVGTSRTFVHSAPVYLIGFLFVVPVCSSTRGNKQTGILEQGNIKCITLFYFLLLKGHSCRCDVVKLSNAGAVFWLPFSWMAKLGAVHV